MSAFLKCYAEANVLIFTSFLFFKICRWLIGRFDFQANYQTITRIAQVLLVASLLLPIAFALIPEKQVPRIQFVVTQPAAELNSSKQIHGSSRLQHRALTLEQNEVAAESTLTQFLRQLETYVAEIHRPELLFLLLLGSVFMIGRLLKNIFAVRRVLLNGIVVRKIGRAVIVVSDSITIPFSTLIGFNAYVVLPSHILGSFLDTKLAIRHEIQHHRQLDTAWALWIEIGICVLFANPVIYLWKKEITELQEFSCDEALIGQRGVLAHDYGSCLIRVAEAALGSRQMLVGTACMASATQDPRYLKSLLGRRIRMFTVHETSRGKKSIALVLGTLSLITTATVAYGAQQVLRPQPPQPHTQPNPGVAVFDPATQAIAQDVLNRAILAYKSKGGFVLVSDPQTGKLLAVANVSKVPTRIGKSWALSYLLEPASVMKGITAASAVDQKLTAFDETLNCENGTYLYGHNLFHDWKPFGQLTVTDTVVNSSNICGIKISERIGSSGLAKMVNEFGFGAGGSTEGFPEAMAGDIPTVDQLTEEEYIALIGTGYTLQGGFHVTPLEMVQAYGAIANGGKLMKPLLANAADSSASVVRQVLSAETSLGMKQVLQKVVLEGTGKPARSKLYTTAGKTGTAYTPGAPDHGSLGGERSIASFAGFAPVNHPRLAIYVGIIDPTNSADHQAHGGEHAGPVFREVAERVLQQLNVPPDKN